MLHVNRSLVVENNSHQFRQVSPRGKCNHKRSLLHVYIVCQVLTQALCELICLWCVQRVLDIPQTNRKVSYVWIKNAKYYSPYKVMLFLFQHTNSFIDYQQNIWFAVPLHNYRFTCYTYWYTLSGLHVLMQDHWHHYEGVSSLWRGWQWWWPRGWSHKFMKSHELCIVTTEQIHACSRWDNV